MSKPDNQISTEEIDMIAVMLLHEDSHNIDGPLEDLSVEEASIAFDNLDARSKRIYREDAKRWAKDNDIGVDKVKFQSTPAREVPDEPAVTLEDIKKKVKVPSLDGVVAALEGKATMSSVLGTEGGQGELSPDDYTKLKDYVNDVTHATADLVGTLAIGGQGLSKQPASDLRIKTHALAIHVHSLVLLLDPDFKGDTLHEQK